MGASKRTLSLTHTAYEVQHTSSDPPSMQPTPCSGSNGLQRRVAPWRDLCGTPGQPASSHGDLCRRLQLPLRRAWLLFIFPSLPLDHICFIYVRACPGRCVLARTGLLCRSTAVYLPVGPSEPSGHNCAAGGNYCFRASASRSGSWLAISFSGL